MLLEFDATFIIAQISFLLFTAIMYIILFEPIREIMKRRKNFISKNEFSARKSNEMALENITKQDEKIKIARKKAAMILSGVKTLLDKQLETDVQNAKKRADARLEKVKAMLEAQKENAREKLEGQTDDFAEAIASKILNREVKITSPSEGGANES